LVSIKDLIYDEPIAEVSIQFNSLSPNDTTVSPEYVPIQVGNTPDNPADGSINCVIFIVDNQVGIGWFNGFNHALNCN